MAFASRLNLADLNGRNGFVINGIDSSDYSSGISVSSIGDINGDGVDDIVIGTPFVDGLYGDGASYIVFGGQAFDSSFNLSELDGSNGFIINGEEGVGSFGDSVSDAGDVNGDGIDDLIIQAGGSPNNNSIGASYVVFGREDFDNSLDLSELSGMDGFVIEPPEDFSDEFKFFNGPVSSAGDINGDSFDDLIILGSYFASDAYIVFGGQDLGTERLNVADLDGRNGFIIGEGYSFSNSVSDAGDINGDGFDDVIIGLDRNNSDTGRSYVLFGGQDFSNGNFSPSELDGFVINDIDNGNFFGHYVSNAGDVNGDGIDDLIIGVPGATANGNLPAGISYVVFGGQDFTSRSFNLSELDGRNGFVINGINRNDGFGSSVSAAGDVNSDGFDDVIVGASDAAPNGNARAGESYVVLGGQDFNSSINLAELDGLNGFVLNGIDAGDNSGASVTTAGDINGDGIDDVLIGARSAFSDGILSAGESYVVFGRAFNAPSFDISSTAFAVEENIVFIANLEAVDDRDTEGNGLTYDITGGADQALFTVDASTGDLNFIAAPNFSNPGDADRDNSYELDITVTDSEGLSETRPFLIEVTDITVFEPTFDLSDLDGENGFVINGINSNYAGATVTASGDINGDGINDLIIGARSADETYIVFGGQDFTSSRFDLADLDGRNGFVLNGIGEFTLSGSSVSNAGDVNGDGIDDLIIGAPLINSDGINNVGESYVVFGRQSWGSRSLNLADLDGSNGFVINGIDEGDRAGSFVSNAGDVDGDGIDDLIIESRYRNYGVGEGYVVFGRQDFGTSRLDLDDLDGSNGFVVADVDGENGSGRLIRNAGDLNGDGINDLLIAATGRSFNSSGEIYVVFGGQALINRLNPADLDGSNGFVINGVNNFNSNRYGDFASHVGDINGDGIDDVLIREYAPGSTVGYTVFGSQNFSNSSLDVAELNGSNGFVLRATNNRGFDFSGGSVSNAGDVNNDGIDDFILGTPSRSPDGNIVAGESYIAFGDQDFSSGSFDLADLDGGNGFVINGVDQGDYSGNSVSNAGDINGDGIDDVIIGARRAGVSGESYVVFGRSSIAPNITVNTTIAISEDTLFVTDVEATDLLDAEGDGLTYSLTDGADQALFTIDATTGELSFMTTPDFDNPSDADADNTYEVEVTVTDSDNQSDRALFTIDVLSSGFSLLPGANGDRLLFPEGSGEIVVGDFDIDEGFEFGTPEVTFDTLEILDGAFQGTYSTTRDFLNLTFAIENDFDGDTDALRDGSDLIFAFGNGDSIRLEDVFGRDGLTVERFEANGGDIFAPDAVL